MRAWITGATGFLGGALARALAAEGAEVHALRRSARADGRPDLPVAWHEGDVTDVRSVRAFLDPAAAGDLVVHAAGRLGEAGVPEDVYRAVNVEGTRNVLAAAHACRSRPRVVHLSSPGVLGPSRAPAREDAPARPTNAYERSKAAAEDVARAFARAGLPVVLARPGFIYGPGDRHVLGLFRAVQRGRFFLVDGGRSLCQPTFVEDAVAGILACLRNGAPGEAYHLCGSEAVSFRRLGEVIADALAVAPPRLDLPRWPVLLGALALEALGRAGRFRPPLSRTGVAFFSEDRVVSCERAARELGWVPSRGLREGVERSVAWYRERGWL